ncbi:MAG TPA: alpha/beta fold hydrolase [Acidobacteriota bacterium]|nr:alpha/beta fold hydrolase [Acidobacteriota bacterium]
MTMRRLLFLFFLVMLIAGLSRLVAQDLSGKWSGAVDVAGQHLPFTVQLNKNSEGAWIGKIDIQGVSGLPLKNVSAEAPKVHFELQAGPGVAVWDGTLEGESVTGAFTQAGIEGTFQMSRADSDSKQPQEAGSRDAAASSETNRAEANASSGTESSAGSSAASGQPASAATSGAESHSSSGEEVNGGAAGSAMDAETRPAPYDEEDFTLDAGEVKLACTYTCPHGDGPFPAVYLITGSGPQDRNETVFGFPVFSRLADQLARHDVIVLRCDDRGVGGSTGDLNQSAIPDFARDALAAVRHLRTRPAVDPRHVGLIGHSEGGIVAPFAANLAKSEAGPGAAAEEAGQPSPKTEADEANAAGKASAGASQVDFIVLLSGTGVGGRELIIEQANRIRAAAGVDDETAAQNQELQRMMLDAAVNDEGWDEVRQRLRQAIEQNWDRIPADQRRSITDKEAFIESMVERQVRASRSKWLRELIAHDPIPSLEKLDDTPVLAIFGENDLQVPPDQNLPPMKSALERAGNSNATFKIIPDANHLFQKSDTGSPTEYSGLEKEFTGGLPHFIAGWIHGLP